MSERFDVREMASAYQRRVLFAIELLDAVTLFRVSQGVKLNAEGLKGKPIVNASGMFVWLEEDFGKLKKISIVPEMLLYEPAELKAAEVKLPPNLNTVELQPRVGYSFSSGITGLRGTLIESRVDPPKPVANAAVRLQWLDDENNWRNAPTTSHTDQKRGDFVSILRLAPADVPVLENGEVTVRLRASRDGGAERGSNNFKLSQGRITELATLNSLTFAWDELRS
jgi:hypothetical protein